MSQDTLRIAVVAPPWYSLPPPGYGGTELVVHLLHSELRRMGHRVTVFGAQGSAAGVLTLADAAWSADLGGPAAGLRQLTYLARVFEQLDGERFDVLHDHSGAEGLLLAIHSRVAPVVVHTIHGQLDEPSVRFYEEAHERARLVAISASQAAQAPSLRLAGVVHNAVEIPPGPPSQTKDGYLVELARICPEKGQHLAIEVARRTGRRLVLAGKIEPTRKGKKYFREQIEPHLGPQVRYLPNVAGAEKRELLARAWAGIFPLQWPEPFGLAMVECMVTGTPALALASGSAPELIEPGRTGFLAHTLEQLVAAVELVDEIDPATCAQVARDRFNPGRMAEGYLAVYRRGGAYAAQAADRDAVRLGPHGTEPTGAREGAAWVEG